MRKSTYEIEQEKEDRRNETLRKLFENGFDYVKIVKEGGGFSASLVGNVRDEEVVDYFEGFYPDQVKELFFLYCVRVMLILSFVFHLVLFFSGFGFWFSVNFSSLSGVGWLVVVGFKRSYRSLCYV